jgi:uncharacterized protein YkwD
MGCGGDIKEKENRPHVDKFEENEVENEKNKKEKEKLEKEKKEKERLEKEKKEKEKLEKEKKEKEKKEKQRTDIDLDTTDFKEENFPLFSSNFFEKFIKNIRKTIIEKNQDGTFNVHKLFVTLDYNKKITKFVKIEKDSSGKKHLIQKFFKGECSLEKAKEDLVKYNDEYHIETNKLLKSPQTTDIYIISQKENDSFTTYLFSYDKKTAVLSITTYKGNNNGYSSSSSSMTNLGPEQIVENYNEYASKCLDYREEVFCVIDPSDVNLDDFTQFQREGLIMHNKYREAHHAPEIKLNKELCEIAQKYAEHLVEINTMVHSHARFKGTSMGENLYYCTGFQPNGGMPVSSWYDEIKDYDFKNGRSKGGVIGHFTQVVWKGTQYVGMGIASKDNTYFVVANYFPAGNWDGQYTNNVLQK